MKKKKQSEYYNFVVKSSNIVLPSNSCSILFFVLCDNNYQYFSLTQGLILSLPMLLFRVKITKIAVSHELIVTNYSTASISFMTKLLMEFREVPRVALLVLR